MERFQVDPVFGRKLDNSIDRSSSWINITPANQLTTTCQKSTIFQEAKAVGQLIKAEPVVSRSVATPVLTNPTPHYITNLIGSPSLEVVTVPSPVPTPQFTNLFGSPPLASFNFYNSPVYTPLGQNVNNFLVPHTPWSPWSPNPFSLNPFSPNPLSPMMQNVYMGYNQDANSELEESLGPKRRRNASPPLNTPAQSPFSSNQTE